jgi:hypothetical protein
MFAETVTKSNISWADRIGRGLMGLAALSALGAFAGGLAAVQHAGTDTIWVETWRMFGFLVFAGMFAIVAWRPRLSAGIWELAFFHKTAMAVSALVLSGAQDAATSGTIDAILAAVILIGYICTRGWTAWKGWK